MAATVEELLTVTVVEHLVFTVQELTGATIGGLVAVTAKKL